MTESEVVIPASSAVPLENVKDTMAESRSADTVIVGTSATTVASEKVKAPPVCNDVTLKRTAMSTGDLAKLVFTASLSRRNSTPPTRTAAVENTSLVQRMGSSSSHPTTVSVSSSSSTCTRDSDLGLDFTGAESNKNSSIPSTPVQLFDKVNASVSLLKTSRQGRATQRWVHDESTNPEGGTIRLVTGCVPILNNGHILMVSANGKPEWIVPKGGWEQDESMEESAIREGFEEAGVLGTLGPKLGDVQYETRKAKKRRLELEQFFNEAQESGKKQSKKQKTTAIVEPEDPTANTNTPLSDEAIARIRDQTSNGNRISKPSEETASACSSKPSYTHVRMTLFPLYVETVADSWPECGRLRKAVPLNEAIEMCRNRPEFKQVLEEVKERGLHLERQSLSFSEER